MVKLSAFLQKSLIFILQAYSYLLSPVFGRNCRFFPNCSKYAQLAIIEHGSFIGLYMTMKRLLCCHPWHPGGFDPVQKASKSPQVS
jgi:putative membrane protein insertion efficiency factor